MVWLHNVLRVCYSSSQDYLHDKKSLFPKRWLWRSRWRWRRIEFHSKFHQRNKHWLFWFQISDFTPWFNEKFWWVVFLHWASNCAWRIKGGLGSCNPANIEIIYSTKSSTSKVFVVIQKSQTNWYIIQHTVNTVAKLKLSRCYREVNDRGSLSERRSHLRRPVYINQIIQWSKSLKPFAKPYRMLAMLHNGVETFLFLIKTTSNT